MVIKHLETKNQELRNLTLNGLTVKAFLNGEATSTVVDWSKCTIKVILNRNGENIVIVQDILSLVGNAATIDLLTQTAFSNSTPFSVKLASGQFLISFILPFGGHINLKGDDSIYIEVKNSDGLFTDPDLLNTSYLEIKPLKSVGIETFVPRIQSRVIQANETTNQYMIGDNVLRCVILNLDKTNFQTNVVENLSFTSDRLTEQYTYADLVQRKLERIGKELIPATAEISDSLIEDQSFVLTDFDMEFDNVMLDIQFNGANVAASKNYIVTWTYETNWGIIEKANEASAKHAAEATAKIDKMSK